ncbi:hypothetical protein K443DRAFT_82075, partial [Laccaria amethystina LaAM-08-1]
KRFLPCCHDDIYSTRDVQESQTSKGFIRTSGHDMHTTTPHRTLLELSGLLGARCRPWRPPPPGSEIDYTVIVYYRNG